MENAEQIKAMHDKIKEQVNLDYIKDIIKDNKLEFEFDKIKYKVSKPTFKQKQEANEKRMAKYVELLKDPKYMLEEDLKKIYKTRNIDIDAMNTKMLDLEQKKKDYLLKLGKGLEDKVSEQELSIFEKEIENLTVEQQLISIQKTSLLEMSIENQVLIFTYNYLSYLITEKLVDEKWVKAFNTYDDFLNTTEDLINKVCFNASLILRNEIESVI